MAEKTVLVTGAARGIGRAVVERFHAAGWRVGAYDVDVAGVESLAELGDRVVPGGLDVRSAADWRTALESLTSASDGQLHVLVNNAGLLRSGEFAAIPREEHWRMVEVNVGGVLNGCHAAYPYLARTPGAAVVNLCSASALYGQPELATYSATKFAVRGLTEALDLEWAREGISVRAVWPLFVDTAMVAGMDIGASRSLGVHLTPADVADVVYAAARPPRRSLGGVHVGVGRQARAMLAGSQVTPSWAMRLVNRRIAGR